jgi:hypothetical protein
MVHIRKFLAILAAFGLAATFAVAVEKSNPGWEKMKGLVGEWQGTYSGKDEHGAAVTDVPIRISYKLVSNGTTLMESISMMKEADMVTMYHPDGTRLLMTHYCSEGNQPRMRAESSSADPKSLAFSYVDATNLASPQAMHMTRLVVTFKDADHFAQDWTTSKNETGRFEYTRKK